MLRGSAGLSAWPAPRAPGLLLPARDQQSSVVLTLLLSVRPSLAVLEKSYSLSTMPVMR